MIKINLFFLILVFIFSSCTSKKQVNKRYQQFDRNSCNNNNDTTTTDELEIIDSSNVHDYSISGTCKRDNSELKIHIEGHPLDKKPTCNRGKWEVTLDLTGIVNKKDRIQVAASQAGSNGLVCNTVLNYFICPDGYIGVPSLDNFTNRSFCVMKFEAKSRNNIQQNSYRNKPIIKAESLAKGYLIQRLNITDAVKYCKENGTGYDLINNDEWQTIARHIEKEYVNWSNATTRIKDGNRLNIGNIGQIQNNSDENIVNDKDWSFHKRYHKLQNSEYIWDLSGNLEEFVLFNNRASTTYSGFVYQIPDSLKDIFGPNKNYSSFEYRERQNGFGGLGYIITNNPNDDHILLRGGRDRQKAGIFSADTSRTRDRTENVQKIGFRCIYNP